MFSERDLLETLSRQDLIALVAHFELSVADKRIKNNLVDSLLSTKQATVQDILEKLSLSSLKALCYEHDIDDSGRLKASLVQRLLAAVKPVKTARANKAISAELKAVSPTAQPKKKPVGRPKKIQAPQAELDAATADTSVSAEISQVSQVAFPELAQISLVAKPDYGKPIVKPLLELASEQLPATAPKKESRKKAKPTIALRPSAQQGAVLGPMHCRACAANFELRKCQVQRCQNWLIVTATRKICAECMFERNTLSMTEFNARLEEEVSCPCCNAPWQHAS